MSGSTSLLDLLSQSQAQKEVSANALFDAMSQGAVFGRRASTTTGLTWGYYGGTFIYNGVPTALANGTLALTGSATNYILRSGGGAIAVTTTKPQNWPGPLINGSIALYEVVTGSSTITSYTDYRYPGMLVALPLYRGENMIRNGGFQICQLGTGTAITVTGAAAGQYTADGWFARRNGTDAGYTVSVASNALTLQRTAANALTSDLVVGQTIDNIDNVAAYNVAASDSFNLAVDIRKGVNFSGTGVKVELLYTSSAAQNILTGAGWTVAASQTVTAANLSTSLPTTFSIPTSFSVPAAGSIGVRITFQAPSGTADAADSIIVTSARLTRGTRDLQPFVQRPVADELPRCQRFIQKSFAFGTAPATGTGANTGEQTWPALVAGAAVQRGGLYPFPVVMARTPNLTLYNPVNANAQAYDATAAADCSSTTLTASDRGIKFVATGAAGTAINNNLIVHWVASAEY